MTLRDRRRRLVVSALMVGLILAIARPGAVAAKGPDEVQLLKRIEKGGTAADHAALASYYREQAKAAAQKAKEHEKLAEQYGPVMGKTDWATHCRSLASYYQKLADDYEAMAELHEGHAAEMRKK